MEGAAFMDIEDVVPFVKWLDDELSYLVFFHPSILVLFIYFALKFIIKIKSNLFCLCFSIFVAI